MIYGIILAGGRGERFWPLSRADKPKQFLKLTSDKTMLEETILRVKPLIPFDRVRIVANESMSQHILSAARNIGPDQILTEPRGRNTCLAVGLSAVHLQRVDPEAVMVVLSTDHLIRPPEKLVSIIEDGCVMAAADNSLVTIGIVPTRPETGYGYIKLGEERQTEGGLSVYAVAAFTEKPKAEVAQEYYYSRNYLWNSGMFVWSARAILDAIREHRQTLSRQLEVYAKAIGTPEEMSARQKLYEEADSISIDYAILENATNVEAIKADIVWDDVGNWLALQRYKSTNGDNNVVVGKAILQDTFETTIYNDCEGMVATLGVTDLVVVRAGDITFVAHKAKLNKLKKLLATIGEDEQTRKYL